MDMRPLEDIQADNTAEENSNSISKDDNTYGYNDNLTSKLGGNYAKIIEFYDGRL